MGRPKANERKYFFLYLGLFRFLYLRTQLKECHRKYQFFPAVEQAICHVGLSFCTEIVRIESLWPHSNAPCEKCCFSHCFRFCFLLCISTLKWSAVTQRFLRSKFQAQAQCQNLPTADNAANFQKLATSLPPHLYLGAAVVSRTFEG